MKTNTSSVAESDEAVVDRARRVVVSKRKARWLMLFYAIFFLGFCGYFTAVGIRKIDSMDAEQLKLGFIYGVAMAVTWTSFGLVGGLCLGKFLSGFQNDFRLQELLVSYHDRLRELGQLPDEKENLKTGQSVNPSGGNQGAELECQFLNPTVAQQRHERVYYGGRWGFQHPRTSTKQQKKCSSSFAIRYSSFPPPLVLSGHPGPIPAYYGEFESV